MKRRRRKSSGSISWDSVGERWVARIWVYRPDGTEARLCKRETTKRKAETWLREMELKKLDGPVGVRMSVGNLLETYLAQVDVKPETLRTYKLAAEKLKPIHHKDAQEIRPSEIDRGLKQIEGARMAELARSVLKSAFKHGMREGLVRANPAELSRPVKYHRKRQPVIVTEDMLENALRKVSCPKAKRFMIFLRHTGCRPWSEALNLEWEGCWEEGGLWWYTGGKTETGKAPRPFSMEIASLWETKKGRLFPSQSTLKREITPHLDGWTLYDLRHTKATMLQQSGVREAVVAALMGHKSIKTTRQFYDHATTEEIARYLSGMGGMQGVPW